MSERLYMNIFSNTSTLYVMCTTKIRSTNFSEEEKLLLAELGQQFAEIENKGYYDLIVA